MPESLRVNFVRVVLASLMLLFPEAAFGAELGSVRVRVVDSSGSVLVGSRVLLQGSGYEEEATTDETGLVRFRGVPAGSSLVRVTFPGFASDIFGADVPVGGQAELEAVLFPEITDEVTITATRLATPASSLPNTVTLVTPRDLQRQTALRDDLAGILEMTVPGFGPSLQKLTGRGESLRGRNPLYTINGVPQFNALRDGQREGHTIDLDFLERVEVIHGSNAIQGIGATGGVVNLVTRSPRSDGSWTHDMKLSLGSFGGFEENGFTSKASYLLGKRFDRFEFLAGVSFHDRDLFFDARDHPIGLYPTQGDIMDSRARGFYLKTAFTPSPLEKLEVSLNDYRLARNGNYVVGAGDRSSGTPTTTEPGDPRPLVGDPAENDVITLSGSYHHLDLLGGEVAVQAYFHDYAALFEGGAFGGFFRLTPDGPPFLDQSEIQSRKVGVKLTHRLKDRRLFGFTPTVGLDVSDDRTVQLLARSDREWVPETGLTEIAPFLQVDRPILERVLFTAGLRLGNARLSVGDYRTIPSAGGASVSGGTPTDTELLPNAGVVFEAGGGLSLFASYSEGYTMPDVGRVLRGVSESEQDVDSLVGVEPVVSSNSEAGAKLSKGRFHLQSAFYHSRSDLGSRLDPDQNGFFRVRREAIRINGVDLSAGLSLSDRVSVGGTYAWVEGRFDSDGDGVVDTDLDGTNIAPDRVNLFLDSELTHWLHARLQMAKLFDREFDGPGISDVRFDGYSLADLLFGLQTEIGTFRVGVRNLFNRFYFTYFAQTEPFARSDTYFAGPGRSFHVVFERRF